MDLFTTFRGRLALLYISVEFSVLLFAGIFLYVMLSKQIYTAVDKQLEQQAHIIVQELQSSSVPFWARHLSRFSAHFIGSVQLVAADGTLLYASDRKLIGHGGREISQILGLAMDGNTAFASTRSLMLTDNMRVLSMPVTRSRRVMAVLLLGRNTNEIHNFFELLYGAGSVLGILSMLISAYAGFVMSRRALKPIDEIARTARAVASGDLSQRLKSFSQDREIDFLIRVLNRMFGDLESSFQAQKRFTADASHELRLPLTVMKGEIEVTLRRKRRAGEYAKVLQQQLSSIERMQRIVDGLLTLARADAGLLELARQEVDLSLLLQEAGQEHLGLFASENVNLDMNISDDLMITGDADRLTQVMYNLLNNAFKHSPPNSTVHIKAYTEKGIAIIEVADEGSGIPEEHMAHLFERFYRADEARSRDEGGAGLGLAICKRIVETHGGQIKVGSEVGKGTLFHLSLPLEGPDPAHTRRLHSVMHTKES